MVVKSDGTKWACQSCLKGHRVTGCDHKDRELSLVAPKGRPVTQCSHCRVQRRKKSAHVGCECADVHKPHHSKEKCIHLRERDEQAQSGFHDDHPVDSVDCTAARMAAVAEAQGCCCPHGGKCTCTMSKKEAGKEKTKKSSRGPAVKPRLKTAKSESHISAYKSHHHRHIQRKHHTAHEAAMPYKPHRISSEENVHANARGSADNLRLETDMSYAPTSYAPSEGRGVWTLAGACARRRMSRSEQPSPTLYANGFCRDTIPNLQLGDYDFGNMNTTVPQHSQGQRSCIGNPFDYLPTEPEPRPADSSYGSWTPVASADALSLPNNNYFGPWATSTNAMGAGQPALTVASSQTQSEIDEIPPFDSTYGIAMQNSHQNAGSMNTYIAPESSDMNRRSLPADFKLLNNISTNSGAGWQGVASSYAGSEVNAEPTFNPDNAWSINTGADGSSHGRPFDFENVPNGGRCASQSIGMTSAPDDQVFKDLFPDMEVSKPLYDSAADLSDYDSGVSIPMSAGMTPPVMNFSPIEEGMDFASQQWMMPSSSNLPNAPYMPPHNDDQGFYRSSDSLPRWAQ